MKTTITILFLLIVTGLFAGNGEININQTVKSSYAEMTLQEMAGVSSFNSALRARQIDFNLQIMSLSSDNLGENILLQLFDDKSYLSEIEKVTTDVNGTTTILTKLVNYNYAYGIIAISGDDVYMTIDIPELREKYLTRIHPQTKGCFVLQLDPLNLNELEGGNSLVLNDLPNENTIPGNTNVPVNTNFKNTSIQPSDIPVSNMNTKLGAADPAVIDVMVVYTPAASAWATSYEGNINNTIAAAMAKANLASTNSGLGITFNLVYSYQVAYTEVNANTDLTALKTNGDGIIDDVHTNRTLYNADMVPMLTFENLTGGLGYVLNSKYGREEMPFCINRVQQVSTSYTMIHEMGHNMGAGHHKDQLTQAGPVSFTDWAENGWSAGWRWTDGANYYCDLMTYSSSSDFADGHASTRIGQFSSPNYTDHGQATGDAVYGDNARTLKEVKHYVAQYRDAETLLYCEAQGVASNYNITNVNIGSIDQTSGGSSYSDFSFNKTDVIVGVNHTLTVDIGNPFGTNQLLVWVDWNNDKDFVDAGEQVYTSGVGSAAQYTTNINPPIGTSVGEKRMRIRLHISNYNGNVTPCGDSDYGDVEDYTLNVVAAPTYSITYTVMNGAAPISGASVTCGSTQTTGANGQVTFTGKANGDYNYTVEAAGFVTSTGTVTVSNGNATKTVNMVAATYDVTFHVTDGTSNLRFAFVTCNGSTVETDASGYAQFTGLPNNTYPYNVVLSGYITATGNVVVSNDNVTQDVVMDIVPEHTVTFTVSDINGVVSGAEVAFNSETDITDGSGVVTFIVPNETYSYVVTKDGYAQETGEVIVTGADVDVPVFLTLQTGYTVTFHVTDGTNNIQNAYVSIDGIAINTDYYGLVAFNDITPADYEYTVTASGFLTKVGNVTVVDGNVSVEVVLDPNNTYTVYFNVSSGGSPLSGASVVFNGSNPPQTTDAFGQTSFTGMVNGTYSYSVTKQGYISDNGNTITVSGANVNKNVSLTAATYSVTFNVTDGTAAIDSALVTFNGQTLATDPTGVIMFANVGVGTGKAYSVSKPNFYTKTGTVDVVDQNVVVDVALDSPLASNLRLVGTPTANTATVEWNGSGATSYRLCYYPQGTTTYSFYTTTSSPFTLQVLEPNTTYDCKIQTLNNGVYTSYSAAISFTTTAGSSILATNLRVVGSPTANTATLAWDGAGATSYQIIVYPEGTTTNIFYTFTSSPAILTALQPSTTYNCQIRTFAGGVYTSYSTAISFTTTAGSSILATNLRVVGSPTANTATLAWDGAGATSYQILVYPQGTTTNTFYTFTSSPATLTALQPSTTYNCRIRTLSGGTYTSYSTTIVSFTTTAGSQVLATNLTVIGTTSNTATLAWDGSGATWYQVVYWVNGTSSYQFKTLYSSPGVLTGLLPGTTYNCRIRTYSGGVSTSYSLPTQTFVTSGSKGDISMDTELMTGIESMNLYPNPVKDVININVEAFGSGKYVLEVLDITGKLMLFEEGYIDDKSYTRQKDVSEWQPGLYLVRIQYNGEWRTMRFVKL